MKCVILPEKGAADLDFLMGGGGSVVSVFHQVLCTDYQLSKENTVTKKICPGYISETIMCRKLILGRDIGWEL